MRDLIDRQQAIDEFWKLEIETRPSWIDAVMNMLNSLPSAQPNVYVSTKDADCISREAVLDAIDKYILGKPEGCTVEVKELLKLITKIYHMPIYRMPSAQYSDAYKAGFNKGYEKAKKEMERQFFVTSDGKVHTITTTWLGDFSPYTCKHCGYHVDSKTRYCPDCGRRASNYEV